MTISDSFCCLDELTQVIYQGAYRFVIISNIAADWNVHLGLADSQGRWWRGTWTDDDINRELGAKASETRVEAFAEKLKEAIVRGELYIGNWRSEKGTDINLTFDPSSKNAVQMPLHEIDAREAAAYATKVFIEIALQAQTRGCCLYPSSYAAPLPVPPTVAPRSHIEAAVQKPATITEVAAEHKTTAAKSRDGGGGRGNKEGSKQMEIGSAKGKGASLANPNKKARKYQAIEFESEEE